MVALDVSPEIKTFLEANAGWSSFFGSLYKQIQKKGGLSEKQIEAVERSMVKMAKTRARQDAMDESFNAEALVETFIVAMRNGLKRPKLVVGDYRFSLAPPSGSNAGHIYVKNDEDGYLGKINPEGDKFLCVRACTEDHVAMVNQIVANPKAAALKYGKESGVCACCARELTDPVSIKAGVGPICADRYAIPYGA